MIYNKLNTNESSLISPFVKYIITPAALGWTAGVLYLSSGTSSFCHEYFGHYILGIKPLATWSTYIIVNDSYTFFLDNLRKIKDKNQTYAIRFKSFFNLFQLEGSAYIYPELTPNKFATKIGYNYTYAWILLSGPLFDAIKYNFLITLGLISIKKGLFNSDNRLPLGIALTCFSFPSLCAHLGYCGFLPITKAMTQKRIDEGWDIEKCAEYLHNATKKSTFMISFGLRSAFLCGPPVMIYNFLKNA